MLNPTNIHALALNFKGVGNDGEVPLYFVKSLSALCFNGAAVPYPHDSGKMWTEVEIGVVVAKDCANIELENAYDYIEGFTVCADVTCRNLYGRDHHLGFSKSRRNFCPTINQVFKIEKGKLDNLEMWTEINGKITQRGFSNEMKYGALASISFVSKITELKKGDIILTGTPAGVENNIIYPGDKVRHFIEGMGILDYSIV